MAGFGQPLVLDWSAYTRFLIATRKGPGGGRLTQRGLQRFRESVLDGELYVCPPFRLEARYSALEGVDFERIDRTLDGFPQADADGSTFAVAMAAQQDLAEAKGVSHRVKPVDLLVAAIAHQHGIGVLHYDADYDALATGTGLTFASAWIARRGSVD